jgi:hypothetical protein
LTVLYGGECLYAFERFYEKERLIVTFNIGTDTANVTLALPEGRLALRFGTFPPKEVANHNKAEFKLSPRTGAVWRVEG